MDDVNINNDTSRLSYVLQSNHAYNSKKFKTSPLPLCKYQAQYRLSQTSNKIVTICSLSGDEIRVDLRVFLQHKPTRIGIYLSPAEFYSLARLYDTILDDLNTQIFMLENESVVGGGLNLTSL